MIHIIQITNIISYIYIYIYCLYHIQLIYHIYIHHINHIDTSYMHIVNIYIQTDKTGENIIILLPTIYYLPPAHPSASGKALDSICQGVFQGFRLCDHPGKQ